MIFKEQVNRFKVLKLTLSSQHWGLTPKQNAKGMMREVCDAGGAIFFSTHVLEVAEKLCDKVAIIKSGKLIRSGIMDDEIQVDYLEKTEEENSESSSENEDYPGEDVVEIVNLKGETTTVYKLADGRYMDRIERIFIFDGVDTWTDINGAEWNQAVN